MKKIELRILKWAIIVFVLMVCIPALLIAFANQVHHNILYFIGIVLEFVLIVFHSFLEKANSDLRNYREEA